MTKALLEAKYGIRIADDSYYRNGKLVKQYKIYSADGCPWENGLATIKAVEQECKQWEKQLLKIKQNNKLKNKIDCKRSCFNCEHKKFHSWDGWDYCMDYEMNGECAKECDRYKYKDWSEEDEHYTPSATAGDYGPSCPWLAPGGRISDYI